MKGITIFTFLFPLTTSLVFICCENSTKEGEQKSYFEDGTLKLLVNYKNGLKYGDEQIYYPSGNLRIKRQWKNDTLIYEQHEYYDTLIAYLKTNRMGDTTISRNPMFKSYSFVNENGEVTYRVDYDMKGEATAHFGKPIVSVFSDLINNKTEVNYRIIYRLAPPPFIENRKFKISVSREKEILDSTLLEIDTEYNLATYSFKPQRPGDYVFEAIYIQRGENKAISDTSYVKIKNGINWC